MAKKKSILLYFDYADQFAGLSDAQFGRLIRHAIHYARTGELSEDDALTDLALAVMKAAIDRDLEKYEAVCERNRESAKKRWEKPS